MTPLALLASWPAATLRVLVAGLVTLLLGCGPTIELIEGGGLPGPLGGCVPTHQELVLVDGFWDFLTVELATRGDRVWFLFSVADALPCGMDRTTPKDVPIVSWDESSNRTERQVYLSWTDDHGSTFATPQRLATVPDAGWSLGLVVDDDGGLWALAASAFGSSTSGSALPWLLLHSEDGGTTWDEVIEIPCCQQEEIVGSSLRAELIPRPSAPLVRLGDAVAGPETGWELQIMGSWLPIGAWRDDHLLVVTADEERASVVEAFPPGDSVTVPHTQPWPDDQTEFRRVGPVHQLPVGSLFLAGNLFLPASGAPCLLLEVPVDSGLTTVQRSFEVEDPLGYCPFVVAMERRGDDWLQLGTEGRDIVLRRPADEAMDVTFSLRRPAPQYSDGEVGWRTTNVQPALNTPLLAADGWLHDVDLLSWEYNAVDTGL